MTLSCIKAKLLFLNNNLIFQTYEKKSDQWVYHYHYQKKLLLRLTIAILIMVTGVSSGFAGNTYSVVTKTSPENEITTDFPENNLAIPLSESQQNLVTGKVTDATTGDPMPGVNIVVKGTSIGTLTDINGQYSINISDPNAVLTYSFVGYNSQEVLMAGKKVIDIRLAQNIESIAEVVVIGYGTAKKSDLTGSIAQVKAEDLGNYSPSTVSDLLRTSIPGLNAGYSVSAKGSSSLLIRGETTLTAGSSPLIVLDGVIFNGDLADINPDDIDRMDVMKDASSAAVYGSRATNGVISITTKKGLSEKPTINISSTVGISTQGNRLHPYDSDGFIQWRSDWFKSVYSKTVAQEPWSPFDDPRTIDPQYLSS